MSKQPANETAPSSCAAPRTAVFVYNDVDLANVRSCFPANDLSLKAASLSGGRIREKVRRLVQRL